MCCIFNATIVRCYNLTLSEVGDMNCVSAPVSFPYEQLERGICFVRTYCPLPKFQCCNVMHCKGMNRSFS